ncbi:NifU-like protein 1, chloroplastic [Tanacetum coccineum]
MKMGIERVLKEKFGDAVKDIVQVYDEQPAETTAVNGHLDILRPAITNFGGSVEVLSVQGGECIVKYTGPESIGSGVKAAIKEKFTDIENVVLTEQGAQCTISSTLIATDVDDHVSMLPCKLCHNTDYRWKTAIPVGCGPCAMLVFVHLTDD